MKRNSSAPYVVTFTKVTKHPNLPPLQSTPFKNSGNSTKAQLRIRDQHVIGIAKDTDDEMKATSAHTSKANAPK